MRSKPNEELMNNRPFYTSDSNKVFSSMQHLLVSKTARTVFAPASKKMDQFGRGLPGADLPLRTIDSSDNAQSTLALNFKLRNIVFVRWDFEEFSVKLEHCPQGCEIQLYYPEAENISPLLREIFLESRNGHLLPEFSNWGDYRLVCPELELQLQRGEASLLSPLSNLGSVFADTTDIHGDEIEVFAARFYSQTDSVDALLIEAIEDEKSGTANSLMHYGSYEPYSSFEIISSTSIRIDEIPSLLIENENLVSLRFWQNKSFYSIDHEGVWVFNGSY